ncbi:serine/threonine protein kinase [Pendulispora albinea]|uniref:Serine/threonine protein kinase n=1 Tax=Pendulispora albinea TaxID=2741071 RepID=A0ABZ2MCJ2_9BACT
MKVGASEEPIDGRYRRIAELGRGGMAVVYLAVVWGPAGFSKLQVIKQLRPELTGELDQVAMFLKEARISARINHPNVVQIHEIGREGDGYFMSMEYVEGQTLDHIFHACKGDIPLRLHLKVIADMLAGLHAAHDLKDFDGAPLEIVHRDVSPSNVLVGYEGEVKVVDFGIAKVVGSRSETRTGVLKGKFTYMAPEQFLGQHVDRRADVFSAGVMLWHAVTKRRLWGRDFNEIEVYRRVIESRIPRPRDVDPTVPRELDDLVMKALATEPANRHQTAEELRIAIEAYLAREGAPPTAREVGALVSELFAEERRTIRAAIEARLREAAHEPGHDPLTDVPLLAALSASAANAEVSSASIVPSSTAGSVISAQAPSPPTYRAHAYLAASIVVLAATILLVAWGPWRQPPSAGGSGSLAPAAGAANGAGGEPASSAASSPSSSIASMAAAAPAATLTELTVRATPSQAKIFMDDIPLGRNPFTGKFLRDGASHRVRVEALGFVARATHVEFSTPTATVDITLDRQTPVWAPPKKDKNVRSPQSGSAAGGLPSASSPSPATSRDVNSDDPWAKRKRPAFDSSDPWK